MGANWNNWNEISFIKIGLHLEELIQSELIKHSEVDARLNTFARYDNFGVAFICTRIFLLLVRLALIMGWFFVVLIIDLRGWGCMNFLGQRGFFASRTDVIKIKEIGVLENVHCSKVFGIKSMNGWKFMNQSIC